MRCSLALCALLAVAAGTMPGAAVAGRALPSEATLLAGGKPWEKKPATYNKPLIGILAQVGGAGWRQPARGCRH